MIFSHQEYILVTSPDYFIELSRLYLDTSRAHSGVINMPYTFRGDDFRHTAKALVAFASRNAKVRLTRWHSYRLHSQVAFLRQA